jgi:hypothetical protein
LQVKSDREHRKRDRQKARQGSQRMIYNKQYNTGPATHHCGSKIDLR